MIPPFPTRPGISYPGRFRHNGGMTKDPRAFPDFGRAASGAFQMFSNLKAEVENLVRQHLERLMGGMDMVSRDEFETVRAMLSKARMEQDRMAKRLATLEAKLGVEAPAEPAEPKKTAARKPAAKKAAAKAPKPDQA